MTSNDIFLGGGTSSGQFNRANLPNIKSSGNWSVRWASAEGTKEQNDWYPFTIGHTSYSAQIIGSSLGLAVSGFNLSLSNSTYNDSNRVNPNYYIVEFWIKFK